MDTIEEIADKISQDIVKDLTEPFVKIHEFSIVKRHILKFLNNLEKPVKPKAPVEYVIVRDTIEVYGCIACCMCIEGKCKESEFTNELCSTGDNDRTLCHWEVVKNEQN